MADSSDIAFRQKRQRKDFQALAKNIAKDSDYQAYLCHKQKNSSKFSVTVTPNDGAYAGHSFKFNFHIPAEYPPVPPQIKCTRRVYHPNINEQGEISLSLIDGWCGDVNNLRNCVAGLLSLFYHPNLDQPLSEYFFS